MRGMSPRAAARCGALHNSREIIFLEKKSNKYFNFNDLRNGAPSFAFLAAK